MRILISEYQKMSLDCMMYGLLKLHENIGLNYSSYARHRLSLWAVIGFWPIVGLICFYWIA